MLIDLAKTQIHLEWLKKKLYLDAISSNAIQRTVKRGDVYECELGVGIGSEMQKKRPCVVIQNNKANYTSPNTIVIPITHDNSTLPCMVPISTYTDANGSIILDGKANTSCIVCVSKARLGDKKCSLSRTDIEAIEESLAVTLGLIDRYNSVVSEVNRLRAYIGKLKQSEQNGL